MYSSRQTVRNIRSEQKTEHVEYMQTCRGAAIIGNNFGQDFQLPGSGWHNLPMRY